MEFEFKEMEPAIVAGYKVVNVLEDKVGVKRIYTNGTESSTDVNDRIGWSVTSGGQTISVSDTGTVSNENRKVVVHTKDAVKYGEASSQIIDVETDNVWGKNNGTYTAILIAYISTGA